MRDAATIDADDDECGPSAPQKRLVDELLDAFGEMVQDEPTVEVAMRALRKLRTGDPVIDQEVAELAAVTMWMWTVYRPAVLLHAN